MSSYTLVDGMPTVGATLEEWRAFKASLPEGEPDDLGLRDARKIIDRMIDALAKDGGETA